MINLVVTTAHLHHERSTAHHNKDQ
uniref:Uncharacterized protein n=1 Tax=Arundo donax TaxID=35708 RepID=A0A0A9CEA4_ARUDO